MCILTEIHLSCEIHRIYKSEEYEVLEIKPCGLVSRIRDVEADLIY